MTSLGFPRRRRAWRWFWSHRRPQDTVRDTDWLMRCDGVSLVHAATLPLPASQVNRKLFRCHQQCLLAVERIDFSRQSIDADRGCQRHQLRRLLHQHRHRLSRLRCSHGHAAITSTAAPTKSLTAAPPSRNACTDTNVSIDWSRCVERMLLSLRSSQLMRLVLVVVGASGLFRCRQLRHGFTPAVH